MIALYSLIECQRSLILQLFSQVSVLFVKIVCMFRYRKNIRKVGLFFILLMTVLVDPITAQVLNDDCQFATPLLSSDNYCSQDGEFTNVGAKADQEFTMGTAACISLKWANGVWFSFVPKQPAVLIRVLGFGNGGTMRSPKIILFQRCGQYVTCSPGKDTGIDELVFDDLNIGQTYFIMVESSIGGEGSFKLCIDDFIPVKAPESDCSNAVVLCDKSSFVVNKLEGNGSDRNEMEPGICIGGEFASAWYKWTCESPGRLTFTLTPNNNFPNQISDDIDFALYELPNGLDDCVSKKLLRCEGAGANTDGFGNAVPLSQWAKCNGPTGLREGETDISEPGGCIGNNNNFVQPIDMEAGKSYVLIINNFSRSGLGFGIQFGGTGTFLGPKPDFDVNANKAFECDKSVIFTNKSESLTDPIVKYTWNFGDRSVPSRSNGAGPFDVFYESFGDKTAALTVESSRGCTVTKIIDFFVDPCCKDTSTLAVNANVKDLICFEIPDGQILANGLRGAPEYSYSLNGAPFRPNPLYGNLPAGEYQIRIQDIKGCVNSITKIVSQPPPIIVDAGPDQTIDLGDSTFIQLTYMPIKDNDTIRWNPAIIEDNSGNYIAYPGNTTSYMVTVVDSNGCIGTDVIEIRVVKNLKVYAPNIFTPNNDGFNDFFNVWASKGVENIELLEIYDRWGNLVYQGVDGLDFTRNDTNSGWDGRFTKKNQDVGMPVVTGVYVWRAKIKWLDGSVGNYAGDVTVLSSEK